MRSYKPVSLPAEMAVVLPDLLFFAAVALLIRCLYLLKPSALCARCALLIAGLVSLWSLLSTGWLITSGVQLQPGILMLLLHDFRNLWPLVEPHLMNGLKRIVPLGVGGFGICVFFLWCLLKPDKVIAMRSHHVRWASGLVMAIVVIILAGLLNPPGTSSNVARESLNFSSHWYAMLSTVTSHSEDKYPLRHSPNIYLSGQRQVEVPKCPRSELPNVVLVLLESVPHSVTSLSATVGQTTPYLAHLASEGVEFRTTRVPIPYTSKAFWATLTATTPVIETDDVEAVPADKPYEGLPSILAKVGYRSAFFEMSKGNFECAPGFFSNLGFDWAWFRENLGDPSAFIGYLGGDDCRMIKPAVEWAKENGEPFFLMTITSLTHDPYIVPDWFEKPKDKIYEKYLQTVRYTDYFLEQLYSELHTSGLNDNTLICIIGDHGTSFRTEQAKGRWIPYEEVIRVPWVIYWPGHIAPGQVIQQPCSQLDVAPTILKLIGFDIANADFDGKDALAKPDLERRLYFSSLLPNSPVGFVEKNRKVVYWPYIEKAFEYDLQSDPEEKNPKIIPPDKVEQIKRDILRWERKSQIAIDAKKHTTRFLFSHWQTFSAGRSAWAYYVP